MNVAIPSRINSSLRVPNTSGVPVRKLIWLGNSVSSILPQYVRGAKAVISIASEILFNMLILIVLYLVFWFLVYGRCGATPQR